MVRIVSTLLFFCDNTGGLVPSEVQYVDTHTAIVPAGIAHNGNDILVDGSAAHYGDRMGLHTTPLKGSHLGFHNHLKVMEPLNLLHVD